MESWGAPECGCTRKGRAGLPLLACVLPSSRAVAADAWMPRHATLSSQLLDYNKVELLFIGAAQDIAAELGGLAFLVLEWREPRSLVCRPAVAIIETPTPRECVPTCRCPPAGAGGVAVEESARKVSEAELRRELDVKVHVVYCHVWEGVHPGLLNVGSPENRGCVGPGGAYTCPQWPGGEGGQGRPCCPACILVVAHAHEGGLTHARLTPGCATRLQSSQIDVAPAVEGTLE